MPSFEDTVGQARDHEVIVDFSAAKDFSNLPKGRYLVLVQSCTPGTSKEGNPKLVWDFVVQEGEMKGRHEFSHTPISGESAGRAKQIIGALGFDVSSNRISFSPGSAEGKLLYINVRPQKNNPDFNDLWKAESADAGDGPSFSR